MKSLEKLFLQIILICLFLIDWIYRNMSDYVNALSYYECALDILQRLLSSDHSRLQVITNDIEFVNDILFCLLKNKDYVH
jgi:hypothetical protein